MSAEPIEQPAQDPSILRHRGPWTERDYFGLPTDSPQRTELLDGSLLVSPVAGSLLVSPVADVQHQRVASRLYRELDGQLPTRLEAFAGANVRLETGKIVIPDVVVAHSGGIGLALDPYAVLLLAEVVSPTSRTMNRLVKPKLYAAAGIPWYLRVQRHDGLELTLYRRRDEESCEVHAKAGDGEVLRLPDFDCSIEVDALTRRRA